MPPRNDAVEQVRADHQRPDRQDARPHRAAEPARDRRRGGRMRRDKGRMTFGLKALFSIAPLLLFLQPSMAGEVTYKDYAEARSGWKHGFVFAISQYMTTVAQAGEEAPYPVRTAYQRCLANATNAVLVDHVEAYVTKNPVNSNEAMVRIVMQALFELCRSEIEKTKLPRAQ
jgi:hypothetical protein